MISKENQPYFTPIRAILALALAWIVPGAGHAFVGRPARGIIIFIVIGATFWGGIAMGGVMTVDHQGQKWWFAAEMLSGIHGLVGWRRESRQLQILKHAIQVGMERERIHIESKITEKQFDHAECEKQIAELRRSINTGTSDQDKSVLRKELQQSVDTKHGIQNSLLGYHAQLSSLRSAHIEKVLAKENLALVAPMATVARVYAGVAGLLNLMCMFDVIMLALIGTVATTEPSDTEDDRQ